MAKSLIYYRNLLFQGSIKRLLQGNTALYIAIQKLRYVGKRYNRKIVAADTDIVIEGYPRSANSFAVKAFKFANGDKYKIATHQHAYPQIVEGVKLNIPTIVLIRNPYDAVISYSALRAQSNGLSTFEKTQNMEWLLRDYVNFYKNLLPYKNQFVIAPFTKVLKDYGSIIEEVNKKYGTNFIPFEHSQDNVDKVFSSAKEHLSPSQQRDSVKDDFRSRMDVLKKTTLFEEAEALFKSFTLV